jgi:hypothetical protein
VKHLFNSQTAEWDLMSSNYTALNDAKTRTFQFETFKINVQFNPQRIKSTSAEVDNETIKNRKCFLCVENLPEEQKGILIENNYLILCNPYPIFSEHFTISLVQHKPQRILNNFSDYLFITKHLSKKYSLIYNGPECGASAPDHLHFQAGSRKTMPIEDDVHQLKNEFGDVVLENDKIAVTVIDDGIRKIIFFESNNESLLKNTFEKAYNIYKEFTKFSIEPMLNIISDYNEEFGWRVIVFLRSKHRPQSFFEEGEKKILVSPAAVDLGGLLITPQEDDFEKMNEETIRKIFREVSLSKGSLLELKQELRKRIAE